MNIPQLSLPKISVGVDFSRLTNLVTSIGAIAVSVVVVFVISWPKFTDVLNLRAENKQLSDRVSSLVVKAEKLEGLDKEQLDGQLAAAEQLLPSDKAVFSLISQIERAANVSGVLLSKVEVAPGAIDPKAASTTGGATTPSAGKGTSETGSTPKIQLKLALTSDFRSFTKFLGNLLSFSRVIAIGDWSLSSSISGGSSQIRTTLTIDAYWQSLPDQLGSVESPIEELTDKEAKLLENVRLEVVESAPYIPPVPTGKSDIFAPF